MTDTSERTRLAPMDKVVLVAGGESALGRKMIKHLLDMNCRVIVPVDGDKMTVVSKTETDNLTVINWNRASWFSTKTVIRETLRLFHRIDAAWVIHEPMQTIKSFVELGSGDIEEVLDRTIKGSIAITRDLYSPLESTEGFLGLVLSHCLGVPGNTMYALAQGAFTGFAEAFIKEASSSIWTCGMQNFSTKPEAFATAIIQLWDERPERLRQRWYRFTEKPPAFKKMAFSDSAH